MSVLPSVAWKTAEQNEVDGVRHAVEFWPSVPFDALERYAETLHSQAEVQTKSKNVVCRANRDKYANGTFYLAVELVFSDEVWIARLRMPHVFGKPMDPIAVVRQMETEAATIRYVREKTTIPVPTVFGYSSNADNVLGMPFMLMSAVRWSLPQHIGVPYLRHASPLVDHYIEDLASVVSKLSTLRFSSIGSLYFDPEDPSKYIVGPEADTGLGPFKTAYEYYSANVDKMEREFLSIPEDTPHEREGRALVLWLLRLVISSIPSTPENNGPFILAHNDLYTENVLCDQDANIVGVIDWASAVALPVEGFVTQCWDCCGDPYRENRVEESPHGKFNAALAKMEPTAPIFDLPSGRTLSQVYSTSTACVLGKYFRLVHNEECNEDPYASLILRHLFGASVTDSSQLKKSAMFKEWYAATLQRIQS